MSVIDAEISLLRAQDDLAEFHREIITLNQRNKELNHKIKLCFDEAIEYKEENRLLRNERDDLKNILNLADDGISELNHHWKVKYSTWKNVEVELRKQRDLMKLECQKQSDTMSTSHKTQIDHLTCSNSKLNQELTILRSENTSLQESVKVLTSQMEMMNEKLKIESQKNIKNMFVSKENDILQGTVEALENRVNTFYEESRSRKTESLLPRSTPRDHAERDLHDFAEISPIPLSKTKSHEDRSSEKLVDEITRLHSYVVEKDRIIEGQLIQLNESVCANEAQLLKIKYYQTTIATAKESHNHSNTNLKNVKEKLVKLNESLVAAKEKLKSATKDNVDLKNSLSIKVSLLAEKEQHLVYYQRCLADQELRYEEKSKELDNFKHTISLMEGEKLSLERTVEEVRGKMACKEHDYHERLMAGDAQKDKVLKDRDGIKSELSVVTQQLKLSLKENTELQSILSSESKEHHSHYVSLEFKFKNVVSELEATMTDNVMVKNQVTILEDTISDTIKDRNELIDNLTETINTLETARNDEAFKYAEKIKSLTGEIDLLKSKIVEVPVFHDKSQNTSAVQEQIKDSQEVSLMKNRLSDLAGELDMKNKLLARAQKELNRKILEVGKNQWEIEKLRVKVSSHQTTQSMTELKPPPEPHLSDHKSLLPTIQKLESDLVKRESSIQDLNKTIQKHLDREQKVVELSDLIAIMQSEIELKQSDMVNEINYYKKKISDIDENKRSMLDKSINTSNVAHDESIMQTSSNTAVQEKYNDLDLSILENVMHNLQAKCENDINNIHNSFCSAIANIGQDHKSESPQWITLSNNNLC